MADFLSQRGHHVITHDGANLPPRTLDPTVAAVAAQLDAICVTFNLKDFVSKTGSLSNVRMLAFKGHQTTGLVRLTLHIEEIERAFAENLDRDPPPIVIVHAKAGGKLRVILNRGRS